MWDFVGWGYGKEEILENNGWLSDEMKEREI
jgi:hypothetical protein